MEKEKEKEKEYKIGEIVQIGPKWSYVQNMEKSLKRETLNKRKGIIKARIFVMSSASSYRVLLDDGNTDIFENYRIFPII